MSTAKSAGDSVSEKRGVKRKLDSKTLETKYEAVIAVERGQKSKKDIAQQFNIPASTLSTWLKNSAEIKQKYLSGETGPQRKRDKKAKFPEIEEALLRWFTNARASNVTISGEILREKARFFADQLGVSESDFDCSVGWLERFKLRHGIVFKRVCGEANSVSMSSDDMADWQSRLSVILSDYSPEDIYNADETGLFYRLMPDRTLEFKNKDCHGGKQSKDRLTALVCANMTGTDKLPILVIGKSANPRCFKHVKTLPTTYRSNKKAWMTSELFVQWVREIDRTMSQKRRSIVLIVDNCPAHPQINGLKSVKLVFLPPNTTSVTQPMDQGIIKNLKVHYRKLVIQRKIRAADKGLDLTISVLDALRMLRHAWDLVTPQTIANCYKHAGFTGEPVSTQDSDCDEIDDDIPLAQLSRLISGASMEQYVSVDDLLPACETLSDNNIVDDLLARRNGESLSEDEEDGEESASVSSQRPTLEAALNACDVLSSFIESCDNSESILPTLSRLNKFVMNVHLCRQFTKQPSIVDFFKKQ